MKATGIVRKLDDLGRITLPMELRRTLGIDLKDPIEIFVDGEKIILRKYAPGCVLCGSADRPLTALYPDKLICSECVKIIIDEQDKLKTHFAR